MVETGYAELHAYSAFTFLEGANQPDAMVRQAAHLGLDAIAVLDVNGMYSAIQTARAGKKYGIPIVHGAEITLKHVEIELPPVLPHANATPQTTVLTKGMGLAKGSEDLGLRLPLLAKSQVGYHTITSMLSQHFLQNEGRREAAFTLEEIGGFLTSQRGPGAWEANEVLALTGGRFGPLRRALKVGGPPMANALLTELKQTFQGNVAVEATLQPHDPPRLAHQLAALAKEHDLPLVATGNPRCARPQDQPLLDVLDATRMNETLEGAEPNLNAWAPFLRSAEEMRALHHLHSEAVDNASHIAQDLTFDLNLIEPGLPDHPVPEGHTEATWLRHVTYEGALRHYGDRNHNAAAWELIDHELKIIVDLGFPGYFLIVKDIVDFCVREGILCQGRGSAANSAVCYALGITAVDAVKHKMLFERFLSPQRRGAPDIDLDIEAQERERVIQYVYETYGRENAALVANVITYRPKSAIRDAGRAFGYGEGQIKRWLKNVGRSRSGKTWSTASDEVPPQVMQVAAEMQKLPRHMGIHPGGMVLTKTPVSSVCPVTWAAMEKRSVLQWDKEDCADAGLVKFDLLGLGMLTALRRCFNWLSDEGASWNGKPLGLHNLPEEDPRVYELLSAAETVGVFQVESRAQMNTLPRMKPNCFYDIVVEVALIRPGPIQGNAVNPYLRRRNGDEPVTYLHPLVKPATEKTLGVPVFQEQLMAMAVDAAGFSPGQSDQLRRAIGAKRADERLQELKEPLFAGMEERGVPAEAQEAIYQQLQGFAEFGFPESHAFSFAYLVYASSWMKVHHPEHFYASLLASQPMGFYSPSSLVEDARRLGVKVAPPSIQFSNVKTEVQKVGSGGGGTQISPLVDAHAHLIVRLGLETVKGLKNAAERIVEARGAGPYESVGELAARATLSTGDLEKLATAGALEDLGVSRREALWSAGTLGNSNWYQPYLPGTEPSGAPNLPEMSTQEAMMADYQSMSLSPNRHPFTFLRDSLAKRGVLTLDGLKDADRFSTQEVAGVVTHRQRPSTAKGTTFLSLEDETGLANIICPVGLWRRYSDVAVNAQALLVRGKVEKKDGAVALVANKLEPLQLPVVTRSRDFH